MVSSADILNYAVAVSVVAVAVAAVAALYYTVKILKQVSDVTQAARDVVDGVSRTVSSIRTRAERAADYLPLILTAIQKVGAFFERRRSERPRPTAERPAAKKAKPRAEQL